MTATNMCSNFGGKWDSPPLITEVLSSLIKPSYMYLWTPDTTIVMFNIKDPIEGTLCHYLCF